MPYNGRVIILPHSLYNSVTLGFIATYFLIGLLIFLSYRSLVDLNVASLWTKHTVEAITTIDDLSDYIYNSTTNLQNYIISIDADFIQTYQSDLQKSGQILNRIQQLTKDNPNQQQKIIILSQIISKLTEIAKQLDRPTTTPQDRVHYVLVRKNIETLATESQSICQNMKNEEIKLFDIRTAKEKSKKSISIIVIIISDTMAIAVTTFAWYLTRKQAKETKNAYEFTNSIVENLPNMLFVKEPKDLRIVLFNKAGENLIGINRNQIIGKTDYDLFSKEQADFYTNKDKIAIEKRVPLYIPEEILPTKRGNVWLRTQKVAIYDGNNLKYLLGISEDITEQKKMASLLAQKDEQLKSSNDSLQHIIYVTSHDLQEPLRMMASFGNLLQEKYNDQLDEKGKKYIWYIVDGASRMKIKINALLEHSRIDRKVIPFHEVNCNEILKAVLNNLVLVITEKNAAITVSELPTIVGDEVLIELLFQNLINNAIKFCNTTPKINISARKANDVWEFSVQDNGIGIDKNYLSKLFVIFQRFHGKDYEGNGIGLAISKKIVEKHGGRIWVESEVDKGSTFYFTLESEADASASNHENEVIHPPS